MDVKRSAPPFRSNQTGRRSTKFVLVSRVWHRSELALKLKSGYSRARPISAAEFSCPHSLARRSILLSRPVHLAVLSTPLQYVCELPYWLFQSAPESPPSPWSSRFHFLV